MERGATLRNAAIGTAVTIVLSFTGFSPLVGGGVAGYLQRDGRSSGAKVGALVGVLSSVVFLMFFGLFFGLFLVGVPAQGAFAVPGGSELLILLVLFLPFAAVWNVGLGALGGYVGAYVREDTADRLDPVDTAH